MIKMQDEPMQDQAPQSGEDGFGEDENGAPAPTLENADPPGAPLAPGLYVVGTPIGNLGDLSDRMRSTLAGAAAVLCEDTRHTRILLDRAGVRTPMVSCHKFNEAARVGEAVVPPCRPQDLGDPEFRRCHGLKYAYAGGSMANGISSLQMVEALAREGLLGFYGVDGLRAVMTSMAIFSPWTDCLVLVLIAAAFVGIGAWLFGRIKV